jgi:hypothetical protein
MWKLHKKNRRPKKCAVDLSAAEAARIDRSNDQPVDARPRAYAGDVVDLLVIAFAVALAAWAFFRMQAGA